MARIARIVVPGVPHHVTQRGIRRLEIFFGDDDYRAYRDTMAEWCAKRGVDIWAYCLTPRQVHLIAVPEAEDSLRGAIGETHRRYTRRINARAGWRGHLWEERFHSCPMDEGHLVSAARYVELNPVAAGLVRRAEDWPWSSARAHLAGRDDGLVTAAPLLERVADWGAFLEGGVDDEQSQILERHQRTGRPLGEAAFIERLEKITGRRLRPGKAGRPRKQRGEADRSVMEG